MPPKTIVLPEEYDERKPSMTTGSMARNCGHVTGVETVIPALLIPDVAYKGLATVQFKAMPTSLGPMPRWVQTITITPRSCLDIEFTMGVSSYLIG